MNAAVIVAAGSATRMGFDKMTAMLAGRPVVGWSLAAFEASGRIDACVLVCAPGRVDEFRRLAHPFAKVVEVVEGGAERSASVLNGVEAAVRRGADLVAVHDGARPLVDEGIIGAVVDAAQEHGAAAAAHPVGDSLRRGSGGWLSEAVEREGLMAMETPQAARGAELLAALKACGAGATDEVGALIRHGVHSRAVVHGRPNPKITWPGDLEVAAALLRARGVDLP
jgi:2-C-methyl-D-erythritol 4-phosphate cytidylyltransferase